MIGTTCVCHLVGCGVHPWCLLPVSVFFRVLKSTRALRMLSAIPCALDAPGPALRSARVLWSYGAARLGTKAVELTFFFFAAHRKTAHFGLV